MSLAPQTLTGAANQAGWRWRRPLLWATAAAALAAVFLAYLNPHLAVDLANLVWACFS